jgi:hypothetical protein
MEPLRDSRMVGIPDAVEFCAAESNVPPQAELERRRNPPEGSQPHAIGESPFHQADQRGPGVGPRGEVDLPPAAPMPQGADACT